VQWLRIHGVSYSFSLHGFKLSVVLINPQKKPVNLEMNCRYSSPKENGLHHGSERKHNSLILALSLDMKSDLHTTERFAS